MTLIFIEGNVEFYIVVYVLATVDQWRSHADLGSYVSCEYGRYPNVIVTRTKDAETKFKFYKKKAKKPLFIHHHSPYRSVRKSIPSVTTRNALNKDAQDKHNEECSEILRLNGYTLRTINEAVMN